MDEESSNILQLNILEDNESNIDQHIIHDINSDEQLAENQNCNLIVNYLPHHIDDLGLKGIFLEFGEIATTKVVIDRNTKKSLGFGFVKFVNEDDAKTAIQRLNGFMIENKCLKVSVARPPSLEIRNCKLYVTNLPKEFVEEDVISLFQEFGDIIECRVLKDKNSRLNKGVAFVQFDNKTQSNNALCLNGCQLEGSPRGLGVKYAEDQHKKREINRLQSLTSNNVYRYMQPGPSGGATTVVGDMSDHNTGLVRPSDRNDMPTSAYYYSSVPIQPMQPSSPPPPPPQHTPQHGLGGINTVYAGGQPIHHLQMPTVQLTMSPPSPAMGAVASPNHFLYQHHQQQHAMQQQQHHQQQQISHAYSAQSGATSPMMGYSPGGMRRNLGNGGGRGRKGYGAEQGMSAEPQLYNNGWFSPVSQQQPMASFMQSPVTSSSMMMPPQSPQQPHSQHLYGPPHQPQTRLPPQQQSQHLSSPMQSPMMHGLEMGMNGLVIGMGGMQGHTAGNHSPGMVSHNIPMMHQQHGVLNGGPTMLQQTYVHPQHHQQQQLQQQPPMFHPNMPRSPLVSSPPQPFGVHQPGMPNGIMNGGIMPVLQPSPYLSNTMGPSMENKSFRTFSPRSNGGGGGVRGMINVTSNRPRIPSAQPKESTTNSSVNGSAAKHPDTRGSDSDGLHQQTNVSTNNSASSHAEINSSSAPQQQMAAVEGNEPSNGSK